MYNVLIIARPGMLRDSLSALLSSMSEIDVVSGTNNLDSALGFVPEHQPIIFIMDFSNSGDEKENKVDQLNTIRPQMKTIALVDEVKIKENAESMGFDKVIFKGSSVIELTNTISDYINESISDLEKTE